MKKILNLLSNYKASKALNVDNSSVVVENNTLEALLIASNFNANKRKLVIVTNNLYNASKLYDSLSSLVDTNYLLYFPSDESFYIEALTSSKEFIYQRVLTLYKLSKLDSYILITHTSAIVRYINDIDNFKSHYIDLKLNSNIKMSVLEQKLFENGYEKVSYVSNPLEYSLRGGVIDFYSLNYKNPIRIEFFGDSIDSIREFDLNSQRTINKLDRVTIIPGLDIVYKLSDIDNVIEKLSDNNIINKVDFEKVKNTYNYHLIYKYYKYLYPYNSLLDITKDAFVILDDLDAIKDNYIFINKETNDFYQNNESNNLYFNIYDVLSYPKHKAYLKRYRQNKNDILFNLRNVESSNGNIRQLDFIIKNYFKLGYKIVLVLDNLKQLDYLNEFSKEYQYILKEYTNTLEDNILYYTYLYLKEGFEIIEQKIIFLTSLEIFNVKNKSSHYIAKFNQASRLDNYDSLTINDYVVHEDYGIGQYLGIETKEFNNVHKDYLHIKYSGSKDLYVPVENFRCVRKYVSSDGIAPKLTNLGTKEWVKTKAKIKNRIKEITDDLLNLYINRTKEIGFAFSADDPYQVEFENAFPYELTIDQQKSLDEIKADMESKLPMDRLLCGDVGFGKTEVAFRAAFKAILNNKQVALLCPTTLLARQHYYTAKERFKNFPVEISMVSRLVSNSDIKKIFNQTEKGNIDLLIGTHKLLNKDLKFKDLGLLIIDEEQRFGVAHKEKIKALKNNIDVLTLSATPIPRTLQTSLIGIKELSQIETPIENRLSVQTYVLEKNYNVAREVIQRELSRNGQVYYIHNNIDTIYELEKKINSLVKEAKSGVIHGRMDKNEIEDIILSFINKDIDILISTTIIENGIDIPNANTMIIDNANAFGLSQLYQLKGRVGRSEKLGFCYLFYDSIDSLSETSKKRLNAIKEFSKLGSGYRIALRDLTIRGAGDLLGKEQAGFIDSVGIDMYLSLLSEAINEAKTGQKNIEEEKIHKKIDVDAYIPKNFSYDDLDKIELYKKITSTKSISELESLKNELDDIYGKLPDQVRLLLEKRRVELYLKEDIIGDIIDLNNSYELIINEHYSNIEGIGIEIFSLVSQIDTHIEMKYYANKIRIRLKKSNSNWLDQTNLIINKLKELFNKYN